MTTFTNTSLHVEAIGTDGGLWHRGLTTGTSFNAWESFGGVCRYYADAVTIGASELHCFVIGMDSALWHKSHDVNGAASPTTGWESLKGVCMTAPCVTSWGPDHIAVFVVGTDRAAWCCQWVRGGKWEWQSLGGKFAYDSLTACCWGEGRIDLFGIGTDNSLQQQCYAGGKWSGGFVSLGGGIFGKPKAIAAKGLRLDIFAKGWDSALWHKCYNGSKWLDWHSLGEVHQYDPEAVVWCQHRIDLFSTRVDTGVIHMVGDISSGDVGTWGSTWEKIADNSTSTPKACVRHARLCDVFFKGSDSSLKRIAWDGASWQPTENLSGGITQKPC